jgi:hypothetical protein
MRHTLHFRALARHQARFWMNQQTRYALVIAERDHRARIAITDCRAHRVKVGSGKGSCHLFLFRSIGGGKRCCLRFYPVGTRDHFSRELPL